MDSRCSASSWKFNMLNPRRALAGRRPRAAPACWRRAPHSPAGSQTLEFNDRSPSRRESADNTVPRRRNREPAPRREHLYENYEALSLHAVSFRAAQAGRLYGRLDVIGSGVGRIERHLSSSCGSIDHRRAGHEINEEAYRGRRLQWVLLQRWLPREIYDRPRPCIEPCCPHHRRLHQHYDTPDPIRRPVAPRPSCSFHNLPESYQTERSGRGKARKVSPRAESSESEDRSEPAEYEEEERADWSILIPEEEGSYFDDADYDSESENTPPQSPGRGAEPAPGTLGESPGPSHEPGPSRTPEPHDKPGPSTQ